MATLAQGAEKVDLYKYVQEPVLKENRIKMELLMLNLISPNKDLITVLIIPQMVSQSSQSEIAWSALASYSAW